MRSSSGAYFVALDQIRALAIFLVVAWHFVHGFHGEPVPFEYTPLLVPFALLNQGHTGVALFMTLSGYLFAKLLDGRAVSYWQFLGNRAMRLVPLLVLVLLAAGFATGAIREDPMQYAALMALGLLLPMLPNGAWSITIEFHFYAVLPLLLRLMRRSRLLSMLVVVAALALRGALYLQSGDIQFMALQTIGGRIDQFVLGMLAWHLRACFARRHVLVLALMAAFMVFYWGLRGGLRGYPSSSPLWIVLPTIEGLAYAAAISWYDNSFAPPARGVSRFIARIGEYSYSIYLLHFFVVFGAARFVHQHIMDISNFYLACLWALGFLVLMVPIGYLSFRFVEAPFLRMRKPYVVAASPVAAAASYRRKSA